MVCLKLSMFYRYGEEHSYFHRTREVSPHRHHSRGHVRLHEEWSGVGFSFIVLINSPELRASVNLNISFPSFVYPPVCQLCTFYISSPDHLVNFNKTENS